MPGLDIIPNVANTKLIIAGGGAALALLAWFVLSRILRGRLTGRLTHVDSVEHFDAVPGTLRVKRTLAATREAARSSIRSRYSIIKKLLGAVLLALAGFVAVFPFLDAIPKALASFLLGVALAIVGVASRPFVENLISGIVISFSNQLKIGDTVRLDEDQYGTVEDINLTHTVVKLWDWKRYIVPNSRMIQKEFLNYSHRDRDLWASIEFRVKYDTDLDVVEILARRAANESEYHVGGEEPFFWVREMDDESLLCKVAAWASSPEDAWYLRVEMRRNLVRAFRDAGIRAHEKRISFEEQPRSTSRRSAGLAPLRA